MYNLVWKESMLYKEVVGYNGLHNFGDRNSILNYFFVSLVDSSLLT